MKAFQSVSSEADELRDGGRFLSYNKFLIHRWAGFDGKGLR
jgi:hypothetical protein